MPHNMFYLKRRNLSSHLFKPIKTPKFPMLFYNLYNKELQLCPFAFVLRKLDWTFVGCFYDMMFEMTYQFCGWNFHIKASEQHFQMVLVLLVYKLNLTFKSVDGTLVCCVTIQMKATVRYFYQDVNFEVDKSNPNVRAFKWKLLSSTCTSFCCFLFL